MHCQAVVHCLHRYTAALLHPWHLSAKPLHLGDAMLMPWAVQSFSFHGGASYLCIVVEFKMFGRWWCGVYCDLSAMCTPGALCTVYFAYHVRWCTITKCTMWGWCAMCIMCTKWGWCAVTLEGSCDIQTSGCGGISWLHYEGWASPSQYFSE